MAMSMIILEDKMNEFTETENIQKLLFTVGSPPEFCLSRVSENWFFRQSENILWENDGF